MKLRSILKNIVVQGKVTMDLVSRFLDAAVLKDELDEKLSGITSQKGDPGIQGPTGPAGSTGPAGADGDDGATGNGIASSSYNSGTGVLTLTFTDTSTYSTGDLRGADSGTAFKYFTDLTASTVTGTTANTILRSILIPANTFTVGSVFDFLIRVSRFSFGGVGTLRIYTNSSNSLSGATLWLTLSLGGGIAYQIISRDVAVLSTTNSEVGNIITSNTAPISVNVNWAINQYFIIAVQPVAVSEIYTNKLISIHPRN
jgi:hypothetical protein